MQPHPLDASHAEWEQRPLILEPAELALDGPATSVERLPPLLVGVLSSTVELRAVADRL